MTNCDLFLSWFLTHYWFCFEIGIIEVCAHRSRYLFICQLLLQLNILGVSKFFLVFLVKWMIVYDFTRDAILVVDFFVIV